METEDLYKINFLLFIGVKSERTFGFSCAGTIRRKPYISWPTITVWGKPGFIVQDGQRVILSLFSTSSEFVPGDTLKMRDRIKAPSFLLSLVEPPAVFGDAQLVLINNSLRVIKLFDLMEKVNEVPTITVMRINSLNRGEVTKAQITRLRKLVTPERYDEIMKFSASNEDIVFATSRSSKFGIRAEL